MNLANEIFSEASVLVLFVLLALAIATDLRNRRIPNCLIVSALNLALIFHTVSAGLGGLMMAIGGLIIGIWMFMPLYAVGGMGAGDVKLLGVVGCFMGPWGAFVAGLATMMLGAVFGISVILWQRLWPRLELHVAQFLMLAGAKVDTVAVSQKHTLGHEKGNTAIPYAPVIAAGTVAALWYIDYLPNQFLG
jgi:prepilin peptidase CpaA